MFWTTKPRAFQTECTQEPYGLQGSIFREHQPCLMRSTTGELTLAILAHQKR